jgi:Coenzyme PQQ synthesis protein D (PqqD)
VTSAQSIPCRPGGVLDYRLVDEMVIYDPNSSQAASLNETASMIWELCDGTRTIHQLCVELAQRFDLLPEDVEKDVRDGVERLCELGLLCA